MHMVDRFNYGKAIYRLDNHWEKSGWWGAETASHLDLSSCLSDITDQLVNKVS